MGISDSRLAALARAAYGQIVEDIARQAPKAAPQLLDLVRDLSSDNHSGEVFPDLRSYILEIPWAAECTLAAEPDLAFHRAVVYSSLNAYLFVRLIDNVMDGHKPEQTALLPFSALFQNQFVTAYIAHFEPASTFWEYVRAFLAEMAETTYRESQERIGSLSTFSATTAKKIAGVKIPIAAVCLRYGRADAIPAWMHFFEEFARFHEMLDDCLDVHDDLKRGRRTFLLEHAAGRECPGQSPFAGVLFEGIPWGFARIREFGSGMLEAAKSLHSPKLMEFVNARLHSAQETEEQLCGSLDRLKSAVAKYEAAG